MPRTPPPICVLVLAAGQTGRDDDAAGAYPPCLSEVDGSSLLERIVENTASLRNATYVFAMLEQEIRKYHLDNIVKVLTPDARVVQVTGGTRGSACTALLATCDADPQSELLVISANELVAADLGAFVEGFRARDLDAGTLVFRSVHPRYSYVRLGEDDLVAEAAQQNPISPNATTGVFWFRRVASFIDAVHNMIRKNAHVDGRFYVCPALNEMILSQARVGVTRIDSKIYFPLKTERQLERFELGPLSVAGA
jgi:hypothetical protein